MLVHCKRATTTNLLRRRSRPRHATAVVALLQPVLPERPGAALEAQWRPLALRDQLAQRVYSAHPIDRQAWRPTPSSIGSVYLVPVAEPACVHATINARNSHWVPACDPICNRRGEHVHCNGTDLLQHVHQSLLVADS